jgi:hypothetical protein
MPRGIPNSRELHSDDVPMREYQALDLTNPQGVLPIALIESVDDDILPADQAARLAFNEEVLTIRLEPRSERNAPKVQDVAVNADRRWLPIGQPLKIQRKFVEALARSQPFSVTTETGTAFEENPRNIIHKTPYRTAPFSVLHDPNPRGAAWLQKVSYEG